MIRMYECGRFLVAMDGDGNLTESLDAGIGDVWRIPEIFMMMNAQGQVVWTNDPCGHFEKAKHDIAMKIPAGKLLWEVN